MKYKECPDCGAHLDHGEPCDCKKKENASAPTETPSMLRENSTLSVADFELDVNHCERLKEIRQSSGILAKDASLAIRETFPKFNRQLFTQCEAWDKYGIVLHPDALRVLCDTSEDVRQFVAAMPAVEIKPPDKSHKKQENRTLSRKMTFRMTPQDFDRVQERIRADGFSTFQAWLYHTITQLLNSEA